MAAIRVFDSPGGRNQRWEASFLQTGRGFEGRNRGRTVRKGVILVIGEEGQGIQGLRVGEILIE
jgi:SLT domain-containing protein